MKLQREAGLISKGGKPYQKTEKDTGFQENPVNDKPLTLSDVGIDKSLANCSMLILSMLFKSLPVHSFIAKPNQGAISGNLKRFIKRSVHW